MPVDLHLHSSVSDGVDSPAELIDLAADAGLSTVALTDHDTLDGIPEAARRAAERDLRFVPGVELSVDHDGYKLHLLVYFTEPGPGPLNDRMSALLAGRADRNVAIVERLSALGYDVTMEDVRAHAAGPSVGRPHIADALVAAGAFANRSEGHHEQHSDRRGSAVHRSSAAIASRFGSTTPRSVTIAVTSPTPAAIR